MKTVEQTTVKDLVKRGRELYPQSKAMRKTWVRHTRYLLQSRRHALIGGGFRASGF